MPLKKTLSISQSTAAYLQELSGNRSAGTVRAYRIGLAHFLILLTDLGLDPARAQPAALNEAHALQFLTYLQDLRLSSASQRLYTTALKGFLEYLTWQKLAGEINLAQIERFVQKRLPRPGQRLPQFPRQEIDTLLDYALSLGKNPSAEARQHLIELRDRALLVTLADTGLRIHEACRLRRGDLDWHEGKAILIGKGDKQAVVRFSARSLAALKNYLDAREPLDHRHGGQLSGLPVFTGHSPRNAGQNPPAANARMRSTPLTPRAAQNIVRQRTLQALGPQAVGRITPHSFRHYFVTNVLRATGGNLRAAQKLARHSQIGTTERYAHLADDELDQVYHEVFNEEERRF